MIASDAIAFHEGTNFVQIRPQRGITGLQTTQAAFANIDPSTLQKNDDGTMRLTLCEPLMGRLSRHHMWGPLRDAARKMSITLTMGGDITMSAMTEKMSYPPEWNVTGEINQLHLKAKVTGDLPKFIGELKTTLSEMIDEERERLSAGGGSGKY